MRKYDSIGIAVPQVLLPSSDIDPTKWAVIACDQYTSEPEYWEKVKRAVGNAPSTLNLIYPEVFLGEAGAAGRIESIRNKMKEYLSEGMLEQHEGFIYVERTVRGKVRKGLMICVDLERYDYRSGSTSLIRATEGTIVARLPPRVKIREGAPLELPHIMVLINDPQNTVIGPVTNNRSKLTRLYDFELMMNSGHLTGYKLSDEALEHDVVTALQNLADPESFCSKYELPAGSPILLYAVGDGNHSLATAKAIWEKIKQSTRDPRILATHPARYAMVELVNIHDLALRFEPIHRALYKFNPYRDLMEEFKAKFSDKFRYVPMGSFNKMVAYVNGVEIGKQKIGIISPGKCGIIEIDHPEASLAVGSIQPTLDRFMDDNGAEEIDYIHGTETVNRIGLMGGNMCLYLPPMSKSDLFRSVIREGALPRKTFSMGEADEKRFYMECRKISL